MEKKALLVYGKRGKYDNLRSFQRNTYRNLELMGKIANSEGYSVEQTPLEEINDFLTMTNYVNKDFLFYFTGHANKKYLGGITFVTNDILKKINEFNGKNIIVLDCCAGDYKGGESFDALDIPKNSKIIGAREVFDNKSLAKILYDIVVLRKNSLSSVDKKMFEDIKHNWIYFMKTA
jgi:hypothetical protein